MNARLHKSHSYEQTAQKICTENTTIHHHNPPTSSSSSTAPAQNNSHLAAKNRRSRNSIRLRLVRIIRDTGIRPLISTRESDQAAGRGGSAPGDLELVTAGVELGAGVRVSGLCPVSRSVGRFVDDVEVHVFQESKEGGREGGLT